MKHELAEIEDHLLVMDAQDGDRKALEQLVRRWKKRLWQHAYRLTADPQAAWDVTQQSWLGILKGLRKLHDPARFKAWAYRITTHKAIDWIKKRKVRKEIPIESIADPCRQEKPESGVKELLQKVAPGGGYCVGSGNSVPDWARFDNYMAMRDTTLKYGGYPIQID